MRLTRRELFWGAAGLPALAAKKPALRPSILLIAVEDVGAWMLGCYGNREIRTPAIDILARSGTRFSNSYAAAPIAAPGRAGILTGRAPHQLGFGRDGAPPASLPEVPTISNVLGGLGYQCASAGPDEAPAVTSKAAQFLDAQKPGQPFLLVVNQPFPASVPSKYLDSYANTTFDTIGWDRPSPEAAANKDALRDIVGNIRKAAAAMTMLDDQVSALVRKLDERGLRDETMIVFTSACGALLGRRGLWGDARATNPPNMYEEVVAVPLIWHWRGHNPPETIRPEFVSAFDMFPSLCELTSAAAPAGARLPGRSYLPMVFSKPFPKKQVWRSLVFAELGDAVMARDKRYKVVLREGGKAPGVLYDEISDPHEKANQYDNAGFITIREELTRSIQSWTKAF